MATVNMSRVHALVIAEVAKAEAPGLKRTQIEPLIGGYDGSVVRRSVLECLHLGWLSDMPAGRLSVTSDGFRELRVHGEAAGLVVAKDQGGETAPPVAEESPAAGPVKPKRGRRK